VPAAVCTVPAAQAPCGVHIDWFALEEYVPLAHAVH
jgi:hypothetical protein